MRIINIAGGILLGIALSQVPEFTQQYRQRLGGAVDELRLVADEFDRTAARAGLDREAALATYTDASSAFLTQRQADMRAVFVRLQRLSDHLLEVEQSGPFAQVVPFIKYFDPILTKRTYDAYQPAIPVTVPGILYAGAGVLAGYGVIALLRRPFRRRTRKATATPT